EPKALRRGLLYALAVEARLPRLRHIAKDGSRIVVGHVLLGQRGEIWEQVADGVDARFVLDLGQALVGDHRVGVHRAEGDSVGDVDEVGAIACRWNGNRLGDTDACGRLRHQFVVTEDEQAESAFGRTIPTDGYLDSAGTVPCAWRQVDLELHLVAVYGPTLGDVGDARTIVADG